MKMTHYLILLWATIREGACISGGSHAETKSCRLEPSNKLTRHSGSSRWVRVSSGKLTTERKRRRKKKDLTHHLRVKRKTTLGVSLGTSRKKTTAQSWHTVCLLTVRLWLKADVRLKLRELSGSNLTPRCSCPTLSANKIRKQRGL